VKAKIKAPVERKVILEMSESKAKVLYQIANWCSYDSLDEDSRDSLGEQCITSLEVNAILEEIYEALGATL